LSKCSIDVNAPDCVINTKIYIDRKDALLALEDQRRRNCEITMLEMKYQETMDSRNFKCKEFLQQYPDMDETILKSVSQFKLKDPRDLEIKQLRKWINGDDLFYGHDFIAFVLLRN
jgi:hypothetical protein